jgi:Ca2+-binding RTX toxin-like protein
VALDAGSGNNTLIGEEGNDLLAGGAGNDTYWFPADSALDSDTVTELAGEGTDLLNFASGTLTKAITLNLSSTFSEPVQHGGPGRAFGDFNPDPVGRGCHRERQRWGQGRYYHRQCPGQ